MANFKGQIRRIHQQDGRDSSIRNIHSDLSRPYSHGVYRLSVATISKIEPEPLYNNTKVQVQLLQNGTKMSGVGIPNASVNTTKAGLPGIVSSAIHGLYESPVMGQQVVVGYLDGNSLSPIVLAKYPYRTNEIEAYEEVHSLPMVKKGYNYSDVALGHYLGSYIALRTIIPIPGTIEVNSVSKIEMTSKLQTEFTALAFNVDLLSGESLKLSPGTFFETKDLIGNKIKLSAIGLEITDSSMNTLKLSPLGFEVSDIAGNSIKFLAGLMTITAFGIETKIGSFGLTSDLDVVAGLSSIPISLLIHKHLGNLGFPTGSSIP